MRELRDYPGYFITESGEVYNSKGEQRPEYHTGIPAYRYVSLPADNKRGWQVRRVHILVAQTYIPNPYSLPMVDHEDRDKMNCHKDNLRWVTRTQNAQNTDNNVVEGGLRLWVRNRCPELDTIAHNRLYMRMWSYMRKNPAAAVEEVYLLKR